VSEALMDWFSAHGRDLPWRRTRDPYAVLVSEVMLQQTQVDRVIPKYHAFLAAYPTLAALAAAPEWRYERIREISASCRAQLVDAGYDVVTGAEQGGLVSFDLGADAEGAAARLYEQRVVVRNVPTTDWLRVSCGWWTSEEDVERLLAAL
jgi:selenocysteine lyase/cysteine desulfurase